MEDGNFHTPTRHHHNQNIKVLLLLGCFVVRKRDNDSFSCQGMT
jgi:hypothetical protein